METKKYRLKKLYPGLSTDIKVGDIFTKFKSYYYCDSDSVCESDVERFPDFWEEIIERTPMGKTSESEVYLDGIDSDFYGGDELWAVELFEYNISKCPILGFYPDLIKYFLTKKAAEDYVKLQKAIKRAVAFGIIEVKRYYIAKNGKEMCIDKNNIPYDLWIFEQLVINPYNDSIEYLTQTIALLTKIKEEREKE